jgi:beta-phosphoglucomutase-like phosphatase (HAD superfamily)
MILDTYDVIILDCDGVIFDSNLLKVEAFKKALHHYD